MTPPLPTALWTTIRVTWTDDEELEREREFTLHPHHIHAGEWVGVNTSFWAGVDEPTDIEKFEVLTQSVGSVPQGAIAIHRSVELQSKARVETARAVIARIREIRKSNQTWPVSVAVAAEEFGALS